MQTSKINLVVDGQVGSCGKGLIHSYLAWAHRPSILSTTSMPNAGHTAILPDDTKFIAKAFPSSAILNTLSDYAPEVIIGAGAAFCLDQLEKEYAECDNPYLTIHPRAGVITEEHKARERGECNNSDSTKHVASTLQGCGTFLSDKVMRKKDLQLARDYESLRRFSIELFGQRHGIISDHLPSILLQLLREENTILHEGSQGFGLDINHGIQYPNCTSRQCTVMQNVADMGLPHTTIGDIYMVIRPYPIRVGNIVEDGKMIGYSGSMPSDCQEISWETVAKNAGLPPESLVEYTTVTKRLRRVFTWSDELFERAVNSNGATKIALNFANYIDGACYGVNQWEDLGTKVHDWIAALEDKHQIEVALVGTGPRVDQVCVV